MPILSKDLAKWRVSRIPGLSLILGSLSSLIISGLEHEVVADDNRPEVVEKEVFHPGISSENGRKSNGFEVDLHAGNIFSNYCRDGQR